MKIPKISIIGAGNVGSTTALMIAEQSLADVAMFDIQEGLAQAKALDISQAMAAGNSNVKIKAAGAYSELKGSDIVVVAAGFTRAPGMSRDGLLKKNAEVIRALSLEIKKNAPGAIVIIVTNPLDAMTYLAYKTTGFDKRRVMGMAGELDAARFKYFISWKTGIRPARIETYVLGSHGDLMVPVLSRTKLDKKPIAEMLDKASIEELKLKTRNAGAQIVGLLKTASAYYGPAASAAQMIKSVLKNSMSEHCVCAYLDGEYGLKDICIGTAAVLGKNGIERIVELKLNSRETESFLRSAGAIRKIQKELGY